MAIYGPVSLAFLRKNASFSLPCLPGGGRQKRQFANFYAAWSLFSEDRRNRAGTAVMVSTPAASTILDFAQKYRTCCAQLVLSEPCPYSEPSLR